MPEVPFQTLDEQLFLWINRINTPLSDQFWLAVTAPIHWLPLFILLSILIFSKQRFKTSLVQLLSLYLCVSLTYTLTQVIKYAVARPRPSALSDIIDKAHIIYEPQHFSFFSGHAATSFSATVFLVLLLKQTYAQIKWLFVWPVLFSLSRIFVGVHYPSDIIVGAVFGTFTGIMCYQLLEVLKLARER